MVEDGLSILSSVVASQLATHARYGGVVPELASREHLRAIVPVVRLALAEAQTTYSDLAAIAATAGPGLVGSLLVGLTFAKSLSFARGIPLIAINHIEGHIHAVVMESKQRGTPIEYPAVALIVSGGHTHLFELHEDFSYRLLGKTRDDAAGEAFDKVAKLLGFGYPGGPVIDQLAPHGNPRAVRFTPAKMKGNALDFSFSGLKTAVLRWVQARDLSTEIQARRDLVAAVACNSGLRTAAREARLPYPVQFPSPALSTDNAAMIAAAAFHKLERGEFATLAVAAQASLPLA